MKIEDKYPPLSYTTKWIVISENSDNDITGWKIGDIIDTYWNLNWYYNPYCFSSDYNKSQFYWDGVKCYMPLAEWREDRINKILND